MPHNIFEADKLSIIELKFIKDQIEAPQEFSIEKIDGYHLENSLQLSFNLEEKLSKVDFKVEIKTNSKGLNADEAIGSFHIVLIYKIENLSELTTLNETQIVEVHPHLSNALSSITYSTSRGLLYKRMQGTVLQKFILPIIDPIKLLG
jgi:hypothetical protein